MTIEELKSSNNILLECISGSRSYGLDLPGSDTDIKGVFVMPKMDYYGMNSVQQVTNDSNDIVFYELGRFVELLTRNNPNILELLGTPKEFIVYMHPLMNELRPELFLSKMCLSSFANYAWSQIKKAKSLNKKIFNPVEVERKSIIDFCFILSDANSQPFQYWLRNQKKIEERCGLAAINHVKDLYALYYDEQGDLQYQGIRKGESSNDVSLSSIPKGEKLEAHLYFNKDGYSSYCKKYREYWDWVDKRNNIRYENTLQHGKNYDSKNMMHVFRLLEMAEEIALGKGIVTKRHNRDYLLSIRKGEFEYEELLNLAEEKLQKIEKLFQVCQLPEKPNEDEINEVLFDIRDKFYKEMS